MEIGNYKATTEDKVFDIINKVLLICITIILAYPLIYVFSASISDPAAVVSGEMWLWPVDITFEGYKAVLENPDIWIGFRNSIMYAFLGTILHLVLLFPAAYALASEDLVGSRFFTVFLLITMLFSGGMIPTYLLVDSLGMVNTIWAVIVPNAIGAWALFVGRSFFSNNIPRSLIESAKIDGAGHFYIFIKIALPLSLPLVAMMAMFHAFAVWNSYFNALIYISDRSLYPLQLFLREILIVFEQGAQMIESGAAGITETLVQTLQRSQQIRYSVIVVSSIPLLLIYPFLQKYFVSGMLIGSVKE